MLQLTLGIVLGASSLFWLPTIPSYGWYASAMIVSVAIYGYWRKHIVIWFSISACLAALNAEQYLEKVEDIPLNRTNTIINVRVSTLINENIPHANFVGVVVDNENIKSPLSHASRLSIYWPNAPTIKQGQIWQLPVKLSRVVGHVNQAGFDAETYALSRQIHGRASVNYHHGHIPLLYSDQTSWRQAMFDQVMTMTQGMPYRSYLVALTFGERGELTQTDWQYLRDSGIAHLLAISGLHIALAMLIGWQVGKTVKLLLPQTLHFIWLPMLFGVATATVYAWLAGFSAPTTRALLMCMIIGTLNLYRVYWRHWQIVLVTLALSVLMMPFSFYSASFWLSFYAVWVLIGFTQSRPFYVCHLYAADLRYWTRVKISLQQLLMMQLWLFIFMLPMQWLWFGGMSYAAPIANLFAVPWISMLTVPLVLVAIVIVWFPTLSTPLWWLADRSLAPVIEGIKIFNGAWYVIPAAYQPVIIGLLFAVFLSFIFPLQRIKWWLCAWGVVIGALFHRPPSPHQWQLLTLDVGHGLAVVIVKNQRAVLYDTANRWQDRMIAQTTVVPVLEQLGISQIDHLIISHNDTDHNGGQTVIERHFSPRYTHTSERDSGYLPCVSGQEWQWQGLTFRVLWPPQLVSDPRNPHSCVVHVQANHQQGPSVLLTGDIDAVAELMLKKHTPSLQADILTVPHHGSKTSSTHTFIEHVKPRLAIVSTGFYNAWQLPADSVKQRYLQREIEWLSTGNHGQVSVVIDDDKYHVMTQRAIAATQWYRPHFLSPLYAGRSEE